MNVKWFLLLADGLVIVWIIKFISSVFAQIDHKNIKTKKKKKIFKRNHQTTIGPSSKTMPPHSNCCNKKLYHTRRALTGLVVLRIDWMSFSYHKEGKEILSRRGGKMSEDEKTKQKKETCVPNCHSVWIQKYKKV